MQKKKSDGKWYTIMLYLYREDKFEKKLGKERKTMEKENKVGKEEVGQKRTQLEKIRTKLYK
jgi:hypothetical protein